MNVTLCSERLRIVTDFLDEEGSPKEGSSGKDVAEGGKGKEGNMGSPNGPRSNLPANIALEAASAQAAEAARSAMAAGLTGSLPPIMSPGRKSALDMANRTYGHPPARPRHMMTCRRPRLTNLPSQEAVQSKECSDRIMAALCKQAYHGVKQVERQVFLGDLEQQLSSGAGAQAAVSGGGRQDGVEGETPGVEDMLETTTPSVSRAVEGDTD